MAVELGMKLLEVLTNDLGEPRMRGNRAFWLCPFHDDHDPSLTITPDGHHWKCFGCGRYGDAIDWVRDRRGLSFSQAVATLNGKISNLNPLVYPRSRLPRFPTIQEPTSSWQAKAAEVTDYCVRELATPVGRKARQWLRNRGLEADTLSRWRIGYNPHGRRLFGLWIERGIIIPWYQSGSIQAINVRRPQGDPKYKLVKGSRRRGLYPDGTSRPKLPTLIVEGEFDALLAWQEIRDQVNIGTLGSATRRPDAEAILQLLGSPKIFLAYDADEAGNTGAQQWQRLSDRIHRITYPTGKDLTDFHRAGGDLKGWLVGKITGSGLKLTRHPTVGLNQGLTLSGTTRSMCRVATRQLPDSWRGIQDSNSPV